MEESSSVFSESPFGTQTSTTTTSSNGKGPGRKGKKLLALVIIIIVLAAVAFGAMQLLGNNTETADVTPTPTVEEFVMPTDEPTPAETEESENTTPTPTTKAGTTPTPTKAASSSSSVDSATKLDRADLTILVQNGSGEAGVAKVMSDKLTALGYNVSGTANADNFDYEQTVIQVKPASKDFLVLLKKDLGTDYTIGSATSDYTGSGDAVVIIGKE